MMMGMQEMLMALLFAAFGGASGNELLDFVDADSYFKSKGVEMTVESMMLEAKKPDVGADASAKEAAVRRLLAIRTLGNLKDKKALGALNSFVDSKEMFVSDYAKSAIAKVTGKPLAINEAKLDQWKSNLPLLPKNTGAVLNLKLGSLNGNAGLMQKFKEMKNIKGMEKMLGEMKKGMIDEAYPVIERIGNVRVDSITVAVAENVGNETGWVIGIINGEYDKLAIKDFVNQDMADGMDRKQVGSAAYFLPEDTVAFAFQDNHTISFIAGPGVEVLPLSEVQTAIDTKNQTITFSENLQKLIEKTNTKGNLCAAGLVTGEMVNTPFIKEFATFRLETELKGKVINGTIIGEGKDAKLVKETMAMLEKMYTNFKDNELKDLKAEMPKSMKPMITAAESLQFMTKEKEGIIRLAIPIVDPLEVVLGLLPVTVDEGVTKPEFIPAE
ncbi:MAG: hypothetical protein ACI9E1_000719 [Cryomorphaceae bacterium]|jgi:hypothetical protein